MAVVALALVAATALVTDRDRAAQRAPARRRHAADVVRDPTQRMPDRIGRRRAPRARASGSTRSPTRRRRAAMRWRASARCSPSVADGLTQGVIALDGERRIEMLNDAARKMLGVPGSLVGEPLLEFVRVPELRALVEQPRDASAEIQLPERPARADPRRAHVRPRGLRAAARGRHDDAPARDRAPRLRRERLARAAHAGRRDPRERRDAARRRQGRSADGDEADRRPAPQRRAARAHPRRPARPVAPRRRPVPARGLRGRRCARSPSSR